MRYLAEAVWRRDLVPHHRNAVSLHAPGFASTSLDKAIPGPAGVEDDGVYGVARWDLTDRQDKAERADRPRTGGCSLLPAARVAF